MESGAPINPLALQQTSMTPNRQSQHGLRLFVASLILVAGTADHGRADDAIDGGATTLFPRDFLSSSAPAPATTWTRSNRIALFRITPGFLTEPVTLDLDDPPSGDSSTPVETDSGPSWLQVSFGGDNPFLDLRQRGDPGGVGYYQLFSQCQLVDTTSTACAVNVKAVSPAGRDMNGVASGPTFVAPELSFFQALDDDLAFQAFVGKKVRLDLHAQGPLQNSVECGMGVNRPLIDGCPGAAGSTCSWKRSVPIAMPTVRIPARSGKWYRACTGK